MKSMAVVRRRAAAVIGMCAALSAPEYPKTPKPPEPVAVSLYVWNAASQPLEIAVSVADSPLFHQMVAAGRSVSRQQIISLLPGRYQGAVVLGDATHPFEIVVATDGPPWLVVTSWGQRCEIRMQQQPPWIRDG